MSEQEASKMLLLELAAAVLKLNESRADEIHCMVHSDGIRVHCNCGHISTRDSIEKAVERLEQSTV